MLRRTIVSALIVGAAAVLDRPVPLRALAALGLIIGLGMAVLNFRFLDAGVAKVQTDGETGHKVAAPRHGHQERHPPRGHHGDLHRSAVPERRVGIGAVAGLVIFQLLFVLNVGRVVMSQGIQ